MRSISGMPLPPINMTSSSSSFPPVKDRIGRLQTAKSAMAKSGVYNNNNNNGTDTSANGDGSEDGTEEVVEEEFPTMKQQQQPETVKEQLMEWGPDIPWDRNVPHLVQIVFEFEPEHSDELDGKPGDRGTAVPFDDDRQWLHVKLQNGKTGIIPTDFIRIIAAVNNNHSPSKVTEFGSPGTANSSTVSSAKQQEEYEMRIREMEEEMETIRNENEALRREGSEREAFMESQANELSEANQTVIELRAQTKNLLIKVDQLVEQRDQGYTDRDRAIAERDRLIRESTNRQRPPQPAGYRADPIEQPSSSSSSPARQDTPTNNEVLPPNWVRGFDKTRNRYFYHNTVTRESVWKLPTANHQQQRPQQQPQQGGAKRKQGQ